MKQVDVQNGIIAELLGLLLKSTTATTTTATATTTTTMMSGNGNGNVIGNMDPDELKRLLELAKTLQK
jgi:hypothetical protein